MIIICSVLILCQVIAPYTADLKDSYPLHRHNVALFNLNDYDMYGTDSRAM